MIQQRKNREVSDSASESDFQNEIELKKQIEAEQKRLKQEQKKESQEYKSKQSKKSQIKQRAYRRRAYIMFLIVSTILLLSSYFIIAYFLAMQTFNTAYAVVGDLQLIFYRGSCFDTTMNFVREDLIRINNIRLAEYNNQSAADYYLNFCLEKEQAYAELKVNLPPYF